MLFFKDIKDKKMADPDFKSFYAEECHICARTLKVIELMESTGERDRILKRLNIPADEYEALKQGDHCRPEQVMRLCRHLDIEIDEEGCHKSNTPL